MADRPSSASRCSLLGPPGAVVRIPTFGMVTTFDAFTGEQEWHLQLWRLGELSGDIAAGTLFEATVYSYSVVLFPLLVFLVRSRAWRNLVRRSDSGRTRPASLR